MSSKSDTEKGAGQPSASGPSDKEKRLAEALRANLRRRKAAPKKPDPSS